MEQDIRWIQRFRSYTKALTQLRKIVRLSQERELTDIEQQGLIQSFEYTHELAWNTLKDFLESKGNTNMYGSRDATRVAFSLGIITNGSLWMDMIISRNQTSHTYNEETAQEVVYDILSKYYEEFILLESTLAKLIEENDLTMVMK